MALWLIIIIGGALIGSAITLRAVARSKLSSERMLEHYRELLTEARKDRGKSKDDKDDEDAESPPSSDA